MPELLTRIDIWIVIIYLAVMLAVAFRVSSGSRDVEGYTVGNRTMRGWVLGISILGTFLSSISFLGLPAKTYEGNWNAFVFGLALPPAALIATLFFVPLYRQGNRLSAYQLLEERFGGWARIYADISYLLLQLIRIGTVLLLVAFAVEPMLSAATADQLRERFEQQAQQQAQAELATGQESTLELETTPAEASSSADEARYVDRMVSILIVLGVLVIVYDTLGGIRAVIWTDVLQVGILLFGAFWCLGEIIFRWQGGAMGFFESIPTEKLSLGAWSNYDSQAGQWDWMIPSVWVILIYGLTENLRNYGSDQNYVQRMLSAESDREAAKSLWIGALTYIPVSVVFCLIGTGLFMEAQVGGANFIPPGLTADQVFPYFIRNTLPSPVAGLVIAAILAAAMSTVDSSLNSCSTVLLADVLRPLMRRGLFTHRISEIVLIRSATVVFGVIGTGMAVLLLEIKGQEGSQVLMDLWWQYAGMAGSGLFGLFLLAWLMPKIPSWGAAVAVIACVLLLSWGGLAREIEAEPYQWLECRLHPNLVGVAGTGVMLLIGGICHLGVSLAWWSPNHRLES